MKKLEKNIRLTGVVLCQLLTAVTIIMLIPAGFDSRLLMALGTLFLILLPEVMERIFHCHFSLGVYLFGILYAIGPMLGHCWNLYYAGIHWDKLLHIAGGVMFALVGYFLCQFLTKGKSTPLMSAVFALCFSMALSMLWEFVEYGCDIFLHTDMQNDSYLTTIHSYFLGDGLGIAGALENITTVTVDGTVLSTQGYVDIGLTDTMQDMLVETLGALLACVVCLVDGGKHPFIKFREATL